MVTNSSTPILIVGKIAQSPVHLQELITLLQPDYDVVHICGTAAIAKTDIPAVMQGEAVGGKIVRVPRVVVVGAGFSEAEYVGLRDAVGEVGAAWAKCERADFDAEREGEFMEFEGRRVPTPGAIDRVIRMVVGREMGRVA